MIASIINQSACASCHLKGACTAADIKEKEVEISHFTKKYSPGQEITILFKESDGFKALFYGYILPFLFVLITLLVVFQLTNNELLSGLVSLGILIPYYTTLYFFRHYLKKVLKFEVEEIN